MLKQPMPPEVGDNQPKKCLERELSDQELDTMYYIKYDDSRQIHSRRLGSQDQDGKETNYPDIFSL